MKQLENSEEIYIGIIKIAETECTSEYIIYNGNYDYEIIQTYSG